MNLCLREENSSRPSLSERRQLHLQTARHMQLGIRWSYKCQKDEDFCTTSLIIKPNYSWLGAGMGARGELL